MADDLLLVAPSDQTDAARRLPWRQNNEVARDMKLLLINYMNTFQFKNQIIKQFVNAKNTSSESRILIWLRLKNDQTWGYRKQILVPAKKKTRKQNIESKF
jgi:hypothetical protein